MYLYKIKRYAPVVQRTNYGWFEYYVSRYQVHGHEDTLHMALWYYWLYLEEIENGKQNMDGV